MKRSPLKKNSKTGALKRKLWKVFSLYIRKRDKYICFTCGRKGVGSGMHAGHFVNKSVGGLALYFDPENVHAQCYNCNINLGGNQYEYAKRLGFTLAEKLKRRKQEYTKWLPEDYKEKIEHYQKCVDNLLDK